MSIAKTALSRRTTKAFDPVRRIPAEVMDQLRTVLRYSPSSVNSQPWHFVIASTDEGRGRVAEGTREAFPYNDGKLRRASHVVVLCARTDLNDAYLQSLLEQETADGRLPTPESRANQHKTRGMYVNMHRFDRKDTQHWMEKQVYLALGTLLLAAGTLGVDACPMEGFDAAKVDEALGLRTRGLTSVVLVALGYSGEGDFNATLPKSRLPTASLFTEI